MTFTRRLTGLVATASISSGMPTCFSRCLGLLSNPFSAVSSSYFLSTFRTSHRCLRTSVSFNKMHFGKSVTNREADRNTSVSRQKAREEAQTSGSLDGIEVGIPDECRHLYSTQCRPFYFALTDHPFSLVSHPSLTNDFFKLPYKQHIPTNRHISNKKLNWFPCNITKNQTNWCGYMASGLHRLRSALFPCFYEPPFPLSINLLKHKINLHKQTHCCAVVFA